MRRACLFLLFALLTALVNLAWDRLRSEAGEPSSSATLAAVAVEKRLADSAELDAMNLSMLDHKIALSLAVETHLQIELLEYPVGAIHDADLKQLVEARRELYCSVLNTLNDLTGGKAANILDGSNGRRHQQGTATGLAETSGSSKGGMRTALQNATHFAILRVRLEIAGQYTDILRAELQALPPTDFDRHFMAADIVNQMQAVAILRVFERQAADDFAKIIRLARTAAERQLTESKQLAERLDTGLVAETPTRDNERVSVQRALDRNAKQSCRTTTAPHDATILRRAGSETKSASSVARLIGLTM